MSSGHEIFSMNPKGSELLESPRHRWEDNVKMDLKKHIGCEVVNWFQTGLG
jgi:hypothetical protein